MALGFSVLRNEVLKLLNETNASVVGELATGVGGAATVSSDNTILDYLNEGAEEMTRTCCYEQGSITISSTTARVNSFATTALWYPQLVKISTTVLTHCGEQELQAFNYNYLNETGTPLYWYKNGPYQIGLYPKPIASVNLDITGAISATPISHTSSAGLITATIALSNASISATNSLISSQFVIFNTSTVTNIVAGTKYYVLSTGLTSNSFQISTTVGGTAIVPTGGTGGTFSVTADIGVFTFAPDDILLKALPAYAAAKIAMKNYDDPSLVGRAFWKDWYDMSRMTLWAQLDTSYKTPGALFAIPPIAPSGK